jgi:Ubiquitin-2 like Rad60 SUMO-like
MEISVCEPRLVKGRVRLTSFVDCHCPTRRYRSLPAAEPFTGSIPIMGLSRLAGDSPDLVTDKSGLATDDRVSLELLLVSGKRQRFDFPASATVGQVKESVWNHWPQVCLGSRREHHAPLELRTCAPDRSGKRSNQTSLLACACKYSSSSFRFTPSDGRRAIDQPVSGQVP